jgi:hypothetical protein
MNDDDFLKKYYQPPRKEFAADLYKRITNPMETRSRFFSLQRFLLASAAVIAVLVMTLLVSPPARALASQLLRQIGVFTLVFDGDGRYSAGQPPQPTAAPFDPGTVQKAGSLAEASTLASFTLLDPEDLPQGFALNGGWSVTEQGNGMLVASEYLDEEGHYLIFNQYKYGSGYAFEQTYASNEQVSDVSVRGQPGVWIAGRLVAVSAGELEPALWLMWEENGINYTLFSDTLTQEDLLKVAESLK